MVLRPLPGLLTRGGGGSRGPRQSRHAARRGAACALSVLHPLVAIARGLGRLAVVARARWGRTPKERRGPTLCLVAAGLLTVGLMPYGPVLAAVAVIVAAGWQGRDRTPPESGPGPEERARLQAVYEALVPYFSLPEDPNPQPLYAHDGGWERAFEQFAFGESGRLVLLRLRYPAYFRDGEREERLRVEQLLCAKAGRGREYRFRWDEECNRLELAVPAPLPTDICAQPFVTAPGEAVLGFTDPSEVRRTLPVTDGQTSRDVPPVIWRTGPRSTEPHLLALGDPGSGVSTLLRSVAIQALRHGDVLVVDGGGSGEFACLTGRRGVLAVESSLVGSLASLEWAVHETERRLLAASTARQAGRALPEDVRRPLWLVVDRPVVLSQLARTEGRRDPQELLEVPLRHGRAARVTVAVAEQFEGADGLGQAVRAYSRARVVLGAVSHERVRAVLGESPQTTPAAHPPPGRGFARMGGGPVLRLQVPATPDPHDEATSEVQRRAVLALLPERSGAVPQAT
ncbi:hypothetical protein LHJ74_00710 [Streptomyces sp. N2-109]|uniref:FtsK domain-containing protein n=1 Tax=Streptomyces gossypii TaxID=2883101 RepID=A0ABT2JKS3_9ACTN|nr:hypothetical protein [Streptomyces gossypii]MCT2588478.1 hypothetical protein [Streptomyces gossypii]